jgi:hypothetical protein
MVSDAAPSRPLAQHFKFQKTKKTHSHIFMRVVQFYPV